MIKANISDSTSNDNKYMIDDLKITFCKSTKLEYNETWLNMFYDYQPIHNTNGIYPKVQFNRRDSNGYIKLNGSNKWLYYDEPSKQSFWSETSDRYFEPLFVWFNYSPVREITVKRYLGKNVEGVMENIYEQLYNTKFLKYVQTPTQIKVSWVDTEKDATKFYYDEVLWSDVSWNKTLSLDQQHKLLENSLD